MREVGFSDKVFFYNSGDKKTRNLRLRVIFTEDIDKTAVQKAADKTLAALPEFAVKAIIKDGKFFYEKNNAPAVVCDDDGATHFIGAEDTNRYMVYFLCGQKSVVISFFHGLADFMGYWQLIQTFIYYYAVETGHSVSNIASSEADVADMDDTERYNPYAKFADVDAKCSWSCDTSNVFTLPCAFFDEDNLDLHVYDIVTSTRQFLDRVHELKTSFVPLLIAAFSGAVADAYGAKEQNIVAKVPADMRPFFGAKTRVNFSDAMFLPLPAEVRKQPLAEQCKYLRANMDKQLNRENFQRLMAKSMLNVKKLQGDIERSPFDNDSPTPVTYSLTYPGRMDLPAEYDALVKNFSIEGWIPVQSFYTTVMTKKDEMLIKIYQRFDESTLADAVTLRLRELGFTAEVTDRGLLRGDKLYVDKLERM